ncbi:MAG: hypothetical protein ACOCZJ_04135 [Thermoplasmatota archaeon]
MTDYAVEYGESTGADEVTVKLREENKHQIRFSKSSINVNKEWETYTVDIFMSKGHRFSLGKRINTLTIQDPDEEVTVVNKARQVNTTLLWLHQ